MQKRQNALTDVAGIAVGSAQSATICSGVTVVLPPPGTVASVDVRGGGPGTLETDALSPDGTVEEVHAVVLSGGSAFGMAASSAVRAWLAERNIGFQVREARVPIVTQAILFDLLNGGEKTALAEAYTALATEACETASASEPPLLGSSGAGYGATTANLRGGLGSASARTADGFEVAALVAVNPAGTVTMGDTARFWAHPFEREGEFGGLGPPMDWRMPDTPLLKGSAGENTTLAVVATDAALDKSQARRLAIMAQTGLARAIHPVHTPLDGDTVYALATGMRRLVDPIGDLARLGSAAADCLARAVARGVYEAAPAGGLYRGPPAYCDRFSV